MLPRRGGPGWKAHWVGSNKTERFPHRWVVADSESRRTRHAKGETQTLRCAVAVRWRDDLTTGTHDEWMQTTDAAEFWGWVDEYCRGGHRTVCWFHNMAYDLRILAAFDVLPTLGWDLEWCNLDSDVSVVVWRSDHGTLTIADTYTWLPMGLDKISAMVGIDKPRLPADDDSDQAWLARCESDVLITREAVEQILAYLHSEHLGNWQPTGAGMGYTAWRHRFMTHKLLVHDDTGALAAEREAMHCGRAEAWWHGKARGGRFTDWDMHMAYCRVAAECDVPVKLWAYDGAASKRVHEWAKEVWIVLCEVEVTTNVPCVPCKTHGRTIWPVGTFRTTLWQPELDLVRRTGGSYRILHQWRYNSAPALREWAEWSIQQCGRTDTGITPVQQSWVKHQSRALIGRLALRTTTWQEWGANYHGGPGLSTMIDTDAGTTHRMMHIGTKTFQEVGRQEADSGLPQVTGYIQSVCRVRLWDAAAAAGLENVLHVDTDSIITNAAGSRQLAAAIERGLPGGWRTKDTWRSIEVIGPRHYQASGRRVLPGVPRAAQEAAPGVFVGEIWESLSHALSDGCSDRVRLWDRTWRPRRIDSRRPWTGEAPHPAQPPRLPAEAPP